jgi:hypothetical protein
MGISLRREHLDTLVGLLSQHIQIVIVLVGGMGRQRRKQLARSVASRGAKQAAPGRSERTLCIYLGFWAML